MSSYTGIILIVLFASSVTYASRDITATGNTTDPSQGNNTVTSQANVTDAGRVNNNTDTSQGNESDGFCSEGSWRSYVKRSLAPSTFFATLMCHDKTFNASFICDELNGFNSSLENKCAEGPGKDLGRKVLDLLWKFVCSDEDFERYVRLVQGTCDEINATCGPKCGASEKFESTVVYWNETIYDNATKEALSKGCQFLECYRDCATPLIAKNLSTDAAGWWRETIKRDIRMRKNILLAVNSSQPVTFPDTCEKIMISASVVHQLSSFLLPVAMTMYFVFKNLL